MYRLSSTLLLLFIAMTLFAQEGVTGRIVEAGSKAPLQGATLTLRSKVGAAAPRFATSDPDGRFVMERVEDGEYHLQVTFIGFRPYSREVQVSATRRHLGTLMLREESVSLGEVTAQGRAVRATQKADTLTYNASAFKTMAGSNTEQLLSKMPGIVVEGGAVQAQGEQVRRVFVDGKPFFEGDPTLALRNLPADIVESIEVFDRMSDQSELTGFDDGNSQKSINIVTRTRNHTSSFGKLTAGYGTEDRYQVGANVNLFKGERRITVLGMSNNVNLQNFSQEDLAGVLSSSGGGNSSRGGGGRGGSSSQNFLIGQLPGVTNTHSAGFNFTDKWFKKVDVTASYFFNRSQNDNDGTNFRTYFDESRGVRTYEELYDKRTNNLNHRFNLRLDWKINDKNSIRFTPSVSLQDNENSSYTDASTLYDGVVANRSRIANSSETDAYTVGGDLLWRRRFTKRGRSLTFGANASMTNNDSESPYASIRESFGVNAQKSDTVNRMRLNERDSYRLRANVSFSEALTKFAALQATYRVSYSNNQSDRLTYNYLLDRFPESALLDTTLSNVYASDYITQVGGLSLRYRKGRNLNFVAAMDGQFAKLMNEQTFPKPNEMERSFFTLLPMVRLDYRLSSEHALRFQLRTSTNEPSVTQLQEVINENNPLRMTTGNPDLLQATSYSSSLRYTLTRMDGKTFLMVLGGTLVNNDIANHTIVADVATDLGGGIILDRGAQLTKPVNLNGNWNMNMLFTFGVPVDWIRSNVNFSANLLFNRLPGLYNYQKMRTHEFRFTPSVVVSSNISDKLDFTATYNARLNFAKNSLQQEQNNAYLQQTATAKLSWEFWRGFTCESFFTYQGYSGLSDGFNEDIYMLNAAVGKKFLKSRALEVKLSAFDLLRQNRALARNVTDAYVEDQIYNVMKPYYMVSCVYDLRLFKKR